MVVELEELEPGAPTPPSDIDRDVQSVISVSVGASCQCRVQIGRKDTWVQFVEALFKVQGSAEKEKKPRNIPGNLISHTQPNSGMGTRRHETDTDTRSAEK